MPRLSEALPFLPVGMNGAATGPWISKLALVLAGVFIGLLGSAFALRRLKV